MKKLLLFIFLMILIVYTLLFQKLSSADSIAAIAAGDSIFYGG